MDDLAHFRQTYITECFELLADMEERLLQLDEGSTDHDSLNAIFRDAHSIKGGAGAFYLNEIAAFTHIQETLLDEMREGRVQATRQVIDVLLKSRDIVYQMVVAAQEEQPVPEGLGKDVSEELEVLIGGNVKTPAASDNGQSASPSSMQTYQIRFVPGDTLLVNGNEPMLLLRELSELGNADICCDTSRLPAWEKYEPDVCYLAWEITLETDKGEAAIREVFEFVEDECTLDITLEDKSADEKVSTAVSPGTTSVKAVAPAATSIRVDIDKVDALINMVGEVVITQAMLASQTRQLPQQEFPDLINGIEELSQHTRELQEAVMAVRMQPVKSVFARMPRLVRDLSAKLGKEVELVMQGEQTEVDKTVIEQLSDPLNHLIRNAIDHGVETPEERETTGKPRQGNVLLSAEHSGGRIVIRIRDDGQGINRERVLQKAIEKDVVPADAQLSDHEIANLIFAPGFSTAAVLSDVSGRGVGMDVVKKNIEGIGGTVAVTSQEGEGSVFTITLPLTLAILDGMIVRIGAEHYVIPIANILEAIRPEAQEVRTVVNGMRVIKVRGEFVPLIYLYEYFKIPDALETVGEALVVLVENGDSHIGLVVDEILGQQQVVIKTLEDNADRIEGISGATILGDGKVSLILDIGGLCRLADDVEHNTKQPLAA